MCKKTPAGECKPAGENLPVRDGNLGSDDEDEPMDSDDEYFSETSSDDGESQSDVDSATGNRVTPDMVVWFMLKQQGFITQENYDVTAELCEDDIKALIPQLPKPQSSESSENETGEGEDLLKAFLEGMARMREAREASKNARETKDTPKEVKEDGGSNSKEVSEVKTNVEVMHQEPQENIENSNEKHIDSVPQTGMPMETGDKESNRCDNMQQKETPVETVDKELNKGNPDESLASPQHVIDETIKEKVSEELIVPKCLKCCKIPLNTENTDATDTDSRSQDENNDITSENNKNLLNENIIQPKDDGNGQEDKIEATSTNTNEESQNVDVNSENKPNQTANKKTRNFKYILKHLVREKRISNEYEYVDVLETYVEDLDKYYKNNKVSKKPSRNLKEFAFFLNYYSPSSYKYIIENFNTPLPEHKELCSWYMKDDDRPGLSNRAFKILKQKAAKKRLTCVLMSRDIFMKNCGLDYDQVDYGGGCNLEYTDKAVMTFVFILVSLEEDWKIPIGYIFAKRVPAETHAEFIRICLTQCHESGVDVVAVTLDSPTPAEFLGCSFENLNNLRTVFKHPICNSEVAVWIDPCLAIRSARHTLKVKGTLHDDTGNKIRWNLIRKLWNLYSNEDIAFRQPKSLQLRNHIAKVGLTTEIFSGSLAPALQLCEELFPDMFGDTAPTRKYIEIMNTLYDVLNSKVISNLDDVMHHLNTAKDYMMALFSNRENALSPFEKENVFIERLQYRSFVEGKQVCGFMGFLICIESFKHLYATLVDKENRLESLNTHRLCKDHVENFVRNLRVFSGIEPDDFNGWEFQSFYDHLFDVLEQNPSFTDKTVKLEHWPMKNKYSPAITIKLTSGKRAFDEVYSFQYRPRKLHKNTHSDQATKLVKQYSKALDTEIDLSSRKNMVGYLAGWIANKFAKSLKCEACIDAMCSDKRQWFHKSITSKHLKGVCLPSEEVFRICWECERALRMKTSPGRLRAWVLRRLLHQFPWRSRTPKHPPQHHIHLARAIITKYIPMRVPTPLNSKDKQLVTEMFSVFTCMNRGAFFSELFRMSANANDE